MQTLLGQQQTCQLLRLTEHWIVSRIELVPSGLEPLSGTALMGFWRIDTALTTNDQRWPRLLPEVVEVHGRFQGGNGMRRVARQGPGARFRIKIGEQVPLGIRARGTCRYSRGLIGRRTIDNLCDALIREQCERVYKDESSDTVTRQLSRLADDHAT